MAGILICQKQGVARHFWGRSHHPHLSISVYPSLTFKPRRVVEDLSLVQWFLDQGADPNARAGKWDITPLSYAVQRAPFETIILLFQSGGSTARGQLLNFAVGRTDSECVPILQYLFDHGDTGINDASFENKKKLQEWSHLGNETPLHHAARVGNIDAVKWLLEHGADPTKRTTCSGKPGDLAVDMAAFYGYMNIVDLLLPATEENVNLLRSEITVAPTSSFNSAVHPPRWIPAPFEMNTVPSFLGTADCHIPTGKLKLKERPRGGHELQDYSMLLLLTEQIIQKRMLKTCRHRISLRNKRNAPKWPHDTSYEAWEEYEETSRFKKQARGEQDGIWNKGNEVDGEQVIEECATISPNFPEKGATMEEMESLFGQQTGDKEQLMAPAEQGVVLNDQPNEKIAETPGEIPKDTEKSVPKNDPEEGYDIITRNTPSVDHQEKLKTPDTEPIPVGQPSKSGIWATLGWR
ncbi:MAG: hypothetical protein Q9170_002484 [Blastenia crenularia]